MIRLGGVLMASGFGKRFGCSKLLQTVEGVPMIQRAFSALPAGLFERAAVVSAEPDILRLAEEAGYLALPNPRAEEGQSASIRLGLSHLLDMDGVLFAVCDQPWLRRESVIRLLDRFCAKPGQVCALSWQGRRGSPAVFPAALFPALLSLTGDCGGGKILRERRCPLCLVEAEGPEELRDVDTPADLEEFGRK